MCGEDVAGKQSCRQTQGVDANRAGDVAPERRHRIERVIKRGEGRLETTEYGGVAASANSISLSTELKVGGSGGKSSAGGTVRVDNNGNIATAGKEAHALIAQSVGADAGNDGLLAFKARLGGTGGVGGNGDEVKVIFGKNASVTTSGDGATAVMLQSIGGSGGYTGAGNISLSFAQTIPVEKEETYWVAGYSYPGSFVPGFWATRKVTRVLGSSGNGGAIIVEMQDPASRLAITTTGDAAHGIYAQTIGGGGGAAFQTAKVPALTSEGPRREAMTGHGGSVSITTRGDIVATGEGSQGIFIQNGRQTASGSFEDYLGQSGTNTIDHTGIITGGWGSGTAIRVEGGGATTINLRAGSTVSAGSGNAIQTSIGIDALTNAGVLIGNIDLATGGTLEKNTFKNETYAVYGSPEGNGVINLGRGGYFTNYGVLDIGGVGKIGALRVNGGDAWLAGVAKVDIDSTAKGSQKNDWMQVSGVANIDGLTFLPNFIGVLPTRYTLMSGQLVEQKPAQFNYSPASPISWQMRSSSGGISVTPSANFMAAASGIGLTNSEWRLMNSLQEVWNAGTGSTYAAQVFGGMASVSSKQQYHDALASASPEGQQQAAIVQSTTGSRTSLKGALSCPAFTDDSMMINETECAWAKITGAHWNQSESAGSFGYLQNSVSYRMGAQWEFKPNWFFGASGAYTSSWGGSDDGFTETKANGGDISLSLKHQMGAWYFAGAAHLGYGKVTTDRIFNFGGDLWFAETDSDVWTAAFRGRVAYEFAFEEWYLRPYLDIDVIHTYVPGYELVGDGARMAADALNDWTFAFSPTVEFGTRINVGEGWLRPYASVGFTYFIDEQVNQNFVFGGENGDGFEFVSTSAAPDFLFDVGVGMQFYVNDRYELRGEYNAQIGDNFLGQEGSVRFSLRF